MKARRNYFDIFYEHRLRLNLDENVFILTAEDLKPLGDAIDKQLDGREACFGSIFKTFANTLTNDVFLGRRLHLSQYLQDVADTTKRLVDLIEEPSQVSSDYPLVHYHLSANWDKSRSKITGKDIGALANSLKILREEALRISADHPAENRDPGRKSYAAKALLGSICAIAEDVGADMELRGSGRTGAPLKPLERFASAAIKLAVDRACLGVTELQIPQKYQELLRTEFKTEQRLVNQNLSSNIKRARKP